MSPIQNELIKFDAGFATTIFSEGYPALILYRNESEDKEKIYEKMMLKLAKQLTGKIMVVISDIISDVEMDFAAFVGIDKEDLPTARIFDAIEILKKYRYNEAQITFENLYRFYSDWHENKLKPYIKSEKVMKFEKGTLLKISGDDLPNLLSNNNMDLVVLYYASNISKSKETIILFESLAKIVKNNTNLIIGAIDVTKNELVQNDFTETPVIRIYPAGRTGNYFEYKESEITLSDLRIFVKRYSKHRVQYEKTDL